MKRIRILGLCLVAAFALSAVAVSSASATLPTFFECKKVGVGKGSFDKTCVTNEGTTKGEYEKLEGIGKAASKAFKGKGGSATLHTPAVGGEITCKAFKDEGRVTGVKTEEKVFSIFTGCATLGKKCTSTGQVVGTIKTSGLKGVIGYINASEKRVGVDLSPEGAELAAFSCEGLTLNVTGSVIGEMSPVNKMSKESKNIFEVEPSGFQKYKNLEGEPNDVLESLVNGAGPFESGQQATAVNKGELLELRA